MPASSISAANRRITLSGVSKDAIEFGNELVENPSIIELGIMSANPIDR